LVIATCWLSQSVGSILTDFRRGLRRGKKRVAPCHSADAQTSSVQPRPTLRCMNEAADLPSSTFLPMELLQSLNAPRKRISTHRNLQVEGRNFITPCLEVFYTAGKQVISATADRAFVATQLSRQFSVSFSAKSDPQAPSTRSARRSDRTRGFVDLLVVRPTCDSSSLHP
jgi:hypothetical protein